MSTFTISIGRRKGTGENLSREDWHKFQARVEEAISNLGGVTYFAGRGGGIYEGVYEESATWVVGADPLPGQVARFERDLAHWLARYGQDSAAVTRGETEFVAAKSLTRKTA